MSEKITDLPLYSTPQSSDVIPVVDVSGPTTKKMTLLQLATTFGGGAVTVADGSDTALGATTDSAVAGDNAGTVNAHLRGLNKAVGTISDTSSTATLLGYQAWLKANSPYAALNTGVPTTAGLVGLKVGANIQAQTGAALNSGAVQGAHVVVVDGSGTQITSFGGSNASVGGNNATSPTSATLLGLKVGANMQAQTGLAVGSAEAAHVAVVDGSGNQVTSFGGSNASVGGTNATAPTSATQLGVKVSANIQGVTGTSLPGSIFAAHAQILGGNGTQLANSASGAADTTYPLKGGGRYNAAGITLDDGDVGDLQLGPTGRLLVDNRNLTASDQVTLAGGNTNAHANLFDSRDNGLMAVTPTGGINQLQVNGNEAVQIINWTGTAFTTSPVTYGNFNVRNFRELVIVVAISGISGGITFSYQIQDGNNTMRTVYSETISANGTLQIALGRGYTAGSPSVGSRNMSLGMIGQLTVTGATAGTLTGSAYLRTN